MTQDKIITLAQEALKKVVTEDYPGHAGKLDPWTICLLERFAALVAAHEREACAKVCEAQQNMVVARHPARIEVEQSTQNMMALKCAGSIRARGQG